MNKLKTLFSYYKSSYGLLSRVSSGNQFVVISLLIFAPSLDLLSVTALVPLLIGGDSTEGFPFPIFSSFSKNQESLLAAVVILVLLSFLSRAFLSYLNSFQIAKIGSYLTSMRLRSQLSLPLTTILKEGPDKLVADINTRIPQILHLVLKPLTELLYSFLVGVVLLGYVFTIAPVLAFLTTVSMGLLYLFCLYFFRQPLRSARSLTGTLYTTQALICRESISDIRTIKLGNILHDQFSGVDDVASKLRRSEAFTQVMSLIPKYAAETLIVIIFIGYYYLSALTTSHSPAETNLIQAKLISVFFASYKVLYAVQTAYSSLVSIYSYGHSYEELLNLEVITLLPELKNPPESNRKPKTNQGIPVPEIRDPRESFAIELRSVSFSYSPQKDIIKRLSITIPPSSWFGVRGNSGSGKSTLLDLICCLVPPTSGSILINGAEAYNDSLLLRDFQESIAVVSQDPLVVGNTMSDYLMPLSASISNHDLEDHHLSQILKISCCDHFIKSLPDGLQTRVLPGGANLSRGQRQRLAIARALLTNPRLLILDEATSGLDEKTEKLVLQNICEYHDQRGFTIVQVSHGSAYLDYIDSYVYL